MADIKLEDNSADKKYFILTPQLVWALSIDPYDYTLWNIIKMIAGEAGECKLSTEDLATLAMMSMGKVSTCRKRLIKAGLLKGKMYQEPGYPQPVWHLKIPNLWKANIAWREQYDAISARLKYKIEQKKSLHLVKPSPGEEGYAPGEEGYAPGETKKNHEKNQKEEPWGGGEKTPPAPPSQPKSKLPPAIQAFRKAAHRYPPKSWYDDIDQAVGRDPPAIQLWHDVVKSYVGMGWNPTAVKNMLEFFSRGEVPHPENGKGGQHANHDRSKRVQGRISEYSVADPAAFDDQRADDAGP